MHRSFSRLFALACFLFFGLASTAHADTYVGYIANASSGDFLYGFTPDGTFVGAQLLHTAFEMTYSGTVTPLPSVYTGPYDNGTPCAPTNTSAYTEIGQSQCNNGHEAFNAHGPADPYYSYGGIYYGPNPATDNFFHGNAGNIKVDSFGDVAFTEYSSYGPSGIADYGVVFFDLTTHTANTPEPNSALLIATALLLLCGLRFRFAHS